MNARAILVSLFLASAVFAQAPRPPVTRLQDLSDVLLSSVLDGQVLSFNASSGKWKNVTGGGGGGTPGGSNTQVQYNNSGAFGGITVATYNGTTLALNGPSIQDGSAVTSVDPVNRQLLDSAGHNMVDWQNGGAGFPNLRAGATVGAVPIVTTTGTQTLTNKTFTAPTGVPRDVYSIYAALGGGIVAEPPGVSINNISTTHTMVSGTVEFVAVYLDVGKTLTGVKWYQSTLGSYTANNNNKVGLYTYSAGTITLVASCANDGTLWQTAASNTWGSKSFSSTYVAVAGLYYVAFLYSNSAQTTAPVLGASATVQSNAAIADFTNSAKIYCSVAGTDLPATQAMSGTAATTARSYVALF